MANHRGGISAIANINGYPLGNFKIPKALVAPCGIGVMVGMSLQIEQDQIGHNVIRVPGMVWLTSFVATIVQFLP